MARKIIIDATDLILGRLASVAAKNAMLGMEVVVVNSEKAVVSGNKYSTIAHYKVKRKRGTPAKGPFFPKKPDMFVRRTIRGMLPHRQGKGRAAFHNVMCHIGVPAEFAGEKFETIKEANVSKLPTPKYIYVKDVCNQLGAKI